MIKLVLKPTAQTIITNENIILKDGASVNGIFFANLLDEYGFINSNKMLRFQIVQDKIGEISFKAEVKTELDSVDKRKLENTLMSFLFFAIHTEQLSIC